MDGSAPFLCGAASLAWVGAARKPPSWPMGTVAACVIMAAMAIFFALTEDVRLALGSAGGFVGFGITLFAQLRVQRRQASEKDQPRTA
jgi:hypothetical protein